MKILYIYPHPDDESYGPANLMSHQRKEGHEVYLLTLTKGGATKQRHKYGYSVEEMGEIRYKEMLNVAKVLDLSGMTVLNLPDSGLKEMDPREIEKVIEEEIKKIKPDVIVTYPVHGISGFHDHLIIHGIVKRVFAESKEKSGYPKRLAFFTLTEEKAKEQKMFHLSGSTPDEIDCIIEVSDEDIGINKKALDCYVTFMDTIIKSDIKNQIQKSVNFEIFQEKHEPKLKDLFEKLQ